MRLIIHAGTHKTASTAFQRFCAANQSCLQSARIFYPKFSDASEHNQLAWLLQKSQLNPIKRFFEQAASDCGQRNCTTTLISSEDFENLLVDTSKIRVLEDIAMQAGFSRIHWVFVVRQSFDYFESLYSELSKHGMSLNYIAMAQAILGHGYFAATNSNYSYKFVFDLAKYYPLFREEVRGASSLISFSEFIDPFPGRAILEIAGADRDTVALLSYSKKSSFDNARLDERAVESNYLANFLGSHLQPHTLQDLESAAEVIIQKRIKLVAEARNEVRNSFFQAFDC